MTDPAQLAVYSACVTNPEVAIEYLRHSLATGDLRYIDSKVINTLTRACIKASPGNVLTIVDYASIEARAAAWMAGDDAALEVFRKKGDSYCRLASTIFNRPITKEDKTERNVGKRGVLGCGYGCGGVTFAAMAEKYGVIWADVPIDPGPHMAKAARDAARVKSTQPLENIAKAIVCVNAWRDLHKPIVQFWRGLETAAFNAVKTGYGECWPTRWYRWPDDSVVCQLPSGRLLRYPEMRVSQGARGEGLSYLGKMSNGGVARIHVHGGVFTENVDQAHCRDLMCAAIVELEREGLPVVLHTHDEIVCDVPEATAAETLKKQEEIMCRVPPWAFGMPVDVEGFHSVRYRK